MGTATRRTITLFLGGDVMTGRGIDQVLAHPVEPALHESHVRDARVYVQLAERAGGPIERPADPEAVWGEALAALDATAPDVRIVNLETAVTTYDEPWPGKTVHYRMNPANAAVLTAARLDACVLANNHVLDWGRPGLEETLRSLRSLGLATPGAGCDLESAARPAVLELAGGARVLVVGIGLSTSGIPGAWAATPNTSGVHLWTGAPEVEARRLAASLAPLRRPGDVVVASVHLGPNWAHAVGAEDRAVAHALVDHAGVDVVHGHSSHHVLPVEVRRGRLILHGCGDLIDDYEGIAGYESFRPDLRLLYLAGVDSGTGALVSLRMIPFRSRRLRLERVTDERDLAWLASRLGPGVERAGPDLELVTPGEGGPRRTST